MAADHLRRLRRRRNGAAFLAAGLLVVSLPALFVLGGEHLEGRGSEASWPRVEATVTSVRLEREAIPSATRTETARITLALDYTFEVDGRRFEITGDRSPSDWGETRDLSSEAEQIRSTGSVEVSYDPHSPATATAFPRSTSHLPALALTVLAVLVGLAALVAFLVWTASLSRFGRGARTT